MRRCAARAAKTKLSKLGSQCMSPANRAKLGAYVMVGIISLAGRPSLVGTWYGTLTSYRADAEQQQPIITTLDVALSIAQSLTSTSVTLLTTQSSSRSVTAEFLNRASEPGSYTLYYTY